MVTFISAGLAGLQFSLMIYYLRRTTELQKSMGVSALGVAASMLGVGCASCGSVVLTSFIGLGSTVIVLRALPFNGQEFGFIGIAILLYSINFTVNKINKPLVC
jgi:hypothetical protein